MKKLYSTDAAIIELLDFFLPLCDDTDTMRRIRSIASDWHRWSDGHDIFDCVRIKLICAERKEDVLRSHQYSFEEVCVKTLYNLSDPPDPFDSDSGFWVLPIALQFAHVLQQEPFEISSLLRQYATA